MALDYPSVAVPRLAGQFYQSPKLTALTGEMVDPLTVLEDSCDDLQTDRWIETAIGRQLDGCGYILRVPRKGMNDEEYRIALKQKSVTTLSLATPKDLILSLKYITQPWVCQYYEMRPATAVLYTDGVGKFVHADIQETIQSISPAAISDVPVCVGYASWSLRFEYNSALMNIGYAALAVWPERAYVKADEANLTVTAGAGSIPKFYEKGLGGMAPPDLWVGDGLLAIGSGPAPEPTMVVTNTGMDIPYGGNYMCGVF